MAHAVNNPFVALHCRLAPRKGLVLVCAGLLCLGAALTAFSFTPAEDVRSLLPEGRGNIARDFALLHRAPFLQRLAISVGGNGTDPGAAADSLAAALQGPEFRLVLAKAPAGAGNPLEALAKNLPLFLEPEELADVDLSRAGITAALPETKRLMLSPAGPALRAVAAYDPLNLRRIFLHRTAPMQAAGLRPSLDGHMLSADGAYALVLAEPARPMSDSAAAGRVMQRIQAAAAELPPGVQVLVAGGHRHAAANAAAIKHDLAKVLPISGCLVLAIFLWGIRNLRALPAFAVPVISLAFAVAAVLGLFGSVSGIVMGFGAILLGITSDYALHVYFAVQGAGGIAAGLRQVTRPLFLGAGTTALSFAALLLSDIPAVWQAAVLSLLGIGVALALSLVLLPLFLKDTDGPGAVQPATVPKSTAFSVWNPRLVLCWGMVLALLVGFGSQAFIDADMRRVAYLPEAVRHDEEALRRIWSDNTLHAMLVVAQADREQALERNDAVWRALNNPALGTPPAYVFSLAPFMPALRTQEQRRQGWSAFWAPRHEEVLAYLQAAAKDAGFTGEAFRPFADSLQTPAPPISGGLPGVGTARLLLGAEEDDTTYLYTLIPQNYTPSPGVRRALEAAGAVLISPEAFRQELGQAVVDDVRFFAFPALLLLLPLPLLLRSFASAASALLPPAAGVCAVLAVFGVFGSGLNLFHLVALPLVVGLAVDYGIFVVHSWGTAQAPLVRRTVLLCLLTSCAGFSGLLVAEHPALASLGQTVSVGLLAAGAMALLVLPRLTGAAKEQA